MKKILHLTVFLALVGALSAGVLSYVNDLTAPIIEEQKLAAVKESLEVLYPGASFSELDAEEETGLVTGAYLAEGKGYIYKVAVTGYNASTPIEFMISISMDGNVDGFVVLAQQETSGIGSRVATDEFKNMVVGKSVNDSVSTLSGATVSSTAVVKGINAAKALYGTQAGVSVEPSNDAATSDDSSTGASNETDNAAVSGDGYTASAQGFHGPVEVMVVVEGNDIVEVKVTKHDETPGIGTMAVEQLPGKIAEADSADVDVVSGATFTSEAIINAVKAALELAGSGSSVEGDSYTAEAQGFGGTVTVTIVLNGDDIVDVKATGPNETPGIGSNAIEVLPQRIIDADSADVDAVSGASVTSEAIITAAKAALAEAGK